MPNCRKKIFITLLWGVTIGAFSLDPVAGAETGLGEIKPGEQNEMNDFLKLNQQLPGAVCDEVSISKPPTLAAFMVSGPNAALQTENEFELELATSESTLISFLMEDHETFLADPAVRKELTAPAALAGLKKKISLEVCTAMVVPGKLEKIFKEKPGYFLPLTPVGGQPPKNSKSGVTAKIRLKDVESRFGKIGSRWWLAGWVEAREVVSVRIGQRIYRRMASPITNDTRFVQVLEQSGVPLAYLYPASEEPGLSLDQIMKQPASLEEAQKKKIETYRLLMELDAYSALQKQPKKGEHIRNLQEFYQNLVKAYQIYPDDARFASYGNIKAPLLPKILDLDFLQSLKTASVNGVHVGLGIFKPDPKLHAIYLEYQDRLKKLK